MKIYISLNSNRETKYKNKIIGKTYENEATILHFELDEEMIDKDFYIEFEKPDGTKYSTSKLDIKTPIETEEIVTHYVEYAIPNSLLDLKGDIKTEVVLRKDGVVFKTYTMKFTILESINATDEMKEKYPDFVSETQKVIDLIEIDGNGSSYLSNDGTYKSLQEIAGGVSDYEQLNNKPQINSIELVSNKSLDSLGIQEKMDTITNSELDILFSDL